MGQYYNAVIEVNGKKDVYYHKVDGSYMVAKLMEHSYWGNPFVLAVASKLWNNKGRLAWVGDYADKDDSKWNEAFADAHTDDAREDLTYNGFRLEGKYFLNHSLKLVIDLDKYKKLLNDVAMVANPISLLTAVGNGKGGGDFFSGDGYEMIGTWAWDVVEIVSWLDYTTKYSDYTDATEDCLFNEW